MPPPFPPPLTRGLSNAQHLTGGEKQADISSLPPSFAYGKSHLPPRGRNNGAPSRRPVVGAGLRARPWIFMVFDGTTLRSFPTIRRGELCSPAVSAPSERGLSNAQHLTGGEIFLSLRHALCACHLPPRGRNIRIAATPLNKNLSFKTNRQILTTQENNPCPDSENR